MGAARQPTQADFDLERFIEMFDEALTSNDERVVNALRSLMMMVILTKSEVDVKHDRNRGPLRQLFDDMHNLNRRLYDTEDTLRNLQRSLAPVYAKEESARAWEGFEKSPNPYSMTAAQVTQAKLAGMQISKEFAQQVNGGLNKPTTKKGI